MADYNESTQRINWMFAKQDLDKIRNESHDRIVKSIIQNNIKKQQLSSVTNTADQQSESAPPTKVQLITPPRSQVIIENPVQTQTEYPIPPELFNSYLTVDEEWALLAFYLTKIFDISPEYCNRAIDYRSVQYYACSYVKRFFLRRSILQYNPKLISAGAYMLALKADEYPPIDAQTLAEVFEEKREDIISAEQKILYANNYDIIIHPPQRILKILDTILKEVSSKEKWKNQFDSNVKKEIYEKADHFLIKVYTTDLEFLFSPSLLTLFVYYSILSTYPNGEDLFKDLIDTAYHLDSEMNLPAIENSYQKVTQSIKEIESLYNQTIQKIESFDLKGLNKKWKKCREYDQEGHKHKHRSSKKETGSTMEKAESVISSQTLPSDISIVSTPVERMNEKRDHPSYSSLL